MSRSTKSPFLHCLKQLNDDAWTQVLLPKLIEQGSAADVALTCSQLRDLCNQNVETIDLKALAEEEDVRDFDRWLQPLPAHYPNCKSAELSLQGDSSYVGMSYILPALARLPKLDAITVELGLRHGEVQEVQEAVPGAAAAMALASMRTLLTGLRDLRLTAHCGLGSHEYTHCWQQLGRFTGLTALCIEFDKQVSFPFDDASLSELSTLTGLQQLQLAAPGLDEGVAFPMHSMDRPWSTFLSHMTDLAELHLTLPRLPGLGVISSLVKLEHLALYGVTRAPASLGEPEWQAIAQLTGLTNLILGLPLGGSGSPACYSALKQLNRLQSVTASYWEHEVLPVFQQLTQLTSIGGAWRQVQEPEAGSSTSTSAPSCPQVQELFNSSCRIPFGAFPNLVRLSHNAPVDLAAVSALTKHLKGLQEFWAQPGPEGAPGAYATLERPLPDQLFARERIAAVMSLSQLTNLRVLGFKPRDDTELAALAAAAAPLLGLKLRRVGVVIEPGSKASNVGLMHLGRLSHLQLLEVWMKVKGVLPGWGEASGFLCALAGLQCVYVFSEYQADVNCMMHALDCNKALGLPMPAVIHLQQSYG